jgi:[calcium/calmodulin-dependent protein kinase] kinase
MFHKMAVEDAYIPQQRLRPVRPSESFFMSSTYKYRSEDIIEIEDVDGMLIDLLRRVLCRNPAQRIRLEAIKHHPWLLRWDETPSNLLANRTALQQNEEMEGGSTDGEASIGFAAFW